MYADLKANLTAMPGHIGDLACITAYARARARARAHTHTHTHCICHCDGKPVRSMPDAGTLAPIRFVTRLPATHESYTDVAWRSVRHWIGFFRNKLIFWRFWFRGLGAQGLGLRDDLEAIQTLTQLCNLLLLARLAHPLRILLPLLLAPLPFPPLLRTLMMPRPRRMKLPA